MPSDERLTTALSFVAAERDAFRSVLAATLEQVRGIVTTNRDVSAELGAFANGRIQFDRFEEIVEKDAKPKKAVLNSIRHAQQLLTATLSVGDQLHIADVPDNGDLFAVTQDALATAARAFAAAYMIEVIRSGREDESKEEVLLAALAPDRWTRAERDIAPPLVVRVSGNDLRVAGFEDLLQGNQKIVLLVDGFAPPSPLVRLISPNVFVMQCRTLEELKRMTRVRGPGIAAVFAEEAATFVYEGTLVIGSIPQDFPKRPTRTQTVFRQKEDLELLKQMSSAQRPADPASQAEPREEVKAGDKLAAWLLKQVELPTV
jgi:hypothetical protein